MDVEIVHYKMPASNKRLRLDGALDMVEKVRLVPGATRGSRTNLPPGDVKVDDERLRAVPDVLILLVFYPARSQWQCGLLAFQGLHTTQFIGAHHAFAFLDQLWRLTIQLIDVFNFLIELFIMNIRQPVPYQMWFEITLFLKASPRAGARFDLRCLVS